MTYNIKIGTTSANSYIIGSDEIPIIERNRDLSFVAPRFTMDVLSSFGTINIGAIVKFYETDVSSTYPIYVGKIIKIETEEIGDSTTTLKRLTVRHIIGELEDYPVNKETINSLLTTGSPSITSEYNSNDGTGPVVQIFYLMERIFEKTGYSLDVTSGLKVATGGSSANTWICQNTQGATTYDIYLNDLVVDENMLYAINQADAVDPVTIANDHERRLLTPSLFDLFSFLCSVINSTGGTGVPGLVPRLNTSGTADDWTLFQHSTTTFTPTWANKKEVNTLTGKSGGYAYELLFNQDRTAYQDDTEDGLIKFDSYVDGDGKNLIDWWSNFVIAYRDKSATNLTIFGLIYSGFPTTPSSEVFFEDTQPTGANGDLWFETDNSYAISGKDNVGTWRTMTGTYNRYFFTLDLALVNKISVIEDTFTQNIYRVKGDSTNIVKATQMNYLALDLDNQKLETRQEFV